MSSIDIKSTGIIERETGRVWTADKDTLQFVVRPEHEVNMETFQIVFMSGEEIAELNFSSKKLRELVFLSNVGLGGVATLVAGIASLVDSVTSLGETADILPTTTTPAKGTEGHLYLRVSSVDFQLAFKDFFVALGLPHMKKGSTLTLTDGDDKFLITGEFITEAGGKVVRNSGNELATYTATYAIKRGKQGV